MPTLNSVENQPSGLDIWGVVEIMGHRKYSGRITEQVIGGAALVRIDVPAGVDAAGNPIAEFSKLVGVGSIYCITPTTEDVARKAAAQLAKYESNPLPVYIPEVRQLPAAAVGSDFEVEEEDELPY